MPQPELILLREQLEDREVANYVPLRERFSLVVLTTTTAGPYSATGLGLPVRTTRTVEGLLGPRLVRRVAERTIGRRVDLQRLRRLPELLGDAGVVIVNETHLASSAQVGELRRRRDDLRMVTVCYENIPFRYEDEARLARRKDVVRATTDLFVALTPEARTALVEEGIDPDRIELQPYGVDADRFAPDRRSAAVRRRWGATDDDVVVLFAGRLLREKGLVPLVRAVARLDGPAVRLVLVGDGPEAPRLTRAAAALGVTVHREPWVDAAQMPGLVASADVVALPSLPTPYWEEQLGFAAIEAMASAVPVVATTSGSIPFVVGGCGLLVPPYDLDALSRAIGQLAADRELRRRIGAAGRDRVVRELNTATVAGALGALIDRVAAGAPS